MFAGQLNQAKGNSVGKDEKTYVLVANKINTDFNNDGKIKLSGR
ncbi:hypothetical protein [Sphingobacterium multivorum]|nr:hypothetical protein [Sphingobacterium multivorum]